jgi:glycosyltransferase involved in cell wall biosynthesis
MIRNVSIVIPVLNEVSTLPKAMESLIACGYPLDCIEFIIVDGGSTDGTIDYVNQLTESQLNIKLLHNLNKTTPYALNLGINAAEHDVIIRADAHALYWPNYILNSVASLLEGNGDNIGGRVLARRGDTTFSKVLCLVMNSKLGSGGASYRGAGEGRLVDTVWCGCWFKETLLKVGLFDVNWINNQDAELNARLISHGMKVYFDPKITAELIVRPSLLKMMLQYYRYGRGRLKTVLRYPSQLSYRQILPILGVLAVLSVLLISPVLFLQLGCLAIVLGFVFYAKQAYISNVPRVSLFWVTPIVFFMNLSWTSGVISAALGKFKRKLRSKLSGADKTCK